MQSRVMRETLALAMFLALGTPVACGKGVNEVAATMTYNAPYVGTAVLRGWTTLTDSLSVPLAATLTMSQIASTVTGTIDVVLQQRATQDTLLAAGVTGRTTSTGLDLTIVQPSGCAMHLSGPLALQGDGSLTGTLVGSDCNATGANNVQLTLALTRQ